MGLLSLVLSVFLFVLFAILCNPIKGELLYDSSMGLFLYVTTAWLSCFFVNVISVCF